MTMLRSSLSRLITNEKTAIKLFDNLNLVGKEGTITFEEFSRVASEDAFQALDILAKNFDKLDKATLKALFTQRQFVRIVPILAEISEFTDTNAEATKAWMKSYTDGQKVVDGFNKQMNNFNNQLQKFNNNIVNAKKSSMDLIKTIGMDLLPLLNSMLKWVGDFEKGNAKVIIQTIQLTGTIAILTSAIKALTSISAIQSGLTLFKNKQFLIIMAVVAGISALYLKYKQFREQVQKTSFDSHLDEMQRLRVEQELVNKNIKAYQKTLDKIGGVSLSEDWNKTFDVIEKTIKKSKEFQAILTNLEKLSALTSLSFEAMEVPERLLNRQESLNKSLSEYSKTLQNITNQRVGGGARASGITEGIIFAPLQRLGDVNARVEELQGRIDRINETGIRFFGDTEAQTEYNLLIKEQEVLQKIVENKKSRLKVETEIGKISEENSKNELEFIKSFENSQSELNRLFSTIEETIVSDVLSQPVKSLKEWRDLMNEMGQETTLKILDDNFSDVTDEIERLNLVTSSLFKKYTPTLEFISQIKDVAEDNIKKGGENVAVWVKVLEKVSDYEDNIVKAIKNQEELNDEVKKTKEYYSDTYKASNLSNMEDKFRLALMDSGIDKLREEERLLRKNLKITQDKSKNYYTELEILDNLKNLGKEYNGEITFQSEAQKKAYEDQVEKVKELEDYLKDIYDIELDLTKVLNEQKNIENEGKLQAIEAQTRELIRQKELQEKITEMDLQRAKTAFGTGVSAISQLTSGQAPTPSFDAGGVSSFLGNLSQGGYTRQKGELDKDYDLRIASDLANTTNFAITQFANVSTLINQKEQQTISNKISMLEIEKSLLTDESDIQAKDEQILQEKLRLIDLQAQQTAQQSMAGGLTSGLGAGLQAGFAGGGLWGGLAVGGLSLLSGLMGAKSAKDEAVIQKQQLERQETTNEILEMHSSLLEKNNQVLEEFADKALDIGIIQAEQEAVAKLRETEEYKTYSPYFDRVDEIKDWVEWLNTYSTLEAKEASGKLEDYISFGKETGISGGEELRKIKVAFDTYQLGLDSIIEKTKDVKDSLYDSLYDGISSALDETNYEDRFKTFGSGISSIIASSIKSELIDANYSDIINSLKGSLLEGQFNISSISDIAQQIQRVTAQTEYDALRLESAMSLFDVGDIDYVNQSQGIQYQTSSSTTQQYVFNNSVNTSIGNLVSNTDKSSLTQYANMLAPYLVQVIEQNLGKKLS